MLSKPPLEHSNFIFHLCFWATCVSIVYGYSRGAPVGVCDTMTPRHRTNQPQESSPPYTLSLSSSSVDVGGNITVTLTADDHYMFRGFLIKAVLATDANSQALGSFVLDNSEKRVYQTLSCSDMENSGITHVAGNDKKSIAAVWQAPMFPGEYSFLATVAQNYTTFWTSFKSAETVAVIGSVGVVYHAPTERSPSSFAYSYSECGTIRSCMGYPSGCVTKKNCLNLLTFSPAADGTEVNFELISKVPMNSYVAMALSTDQNMGDDSVIQCFSTSNVQMSASTNKGYSNIKADGNPQHFTPIRTSFVDGVLNCSFSRRMETTVGGIMTDMKNNEYHLLLVSGPLSHDQTDITHHLRKMYSAEAVDLTRAQNIVILGGDSVPVPIEVVIHGALMVVAWVGTASIAIFLARYYKDMWPEKTHCNVKIWFAWHRGLNIVTVLLTSAAFVLIFVFAGISHIWQSSFNIHPILGTVTVILMLLQPIGALFRPNPGSPRRPIFNWLHYFGGMFASIGAVITIFYAVTLRMAQLPTYFWWIMIAYVAFYIVLFCVMEFFTCLSSRKAEKEVIPMKDYSANDGSFHIMNQTEPQGARFKEVMLILFSVGVLGFTAALVAVIAT